MPAMPNNPLIESVRALAEAQKCGALFDKLHRVASGQFMASRLSFDFPALLAALERAERIEKAAKRCDLLAVSNSLGCIGCHRSAESLMALDAALSEPQ